MRLDVEEAVSLLKKFSSESTPLEGFLMTKSGKFEASVKGQIGYADDRIYVTAQNTKDRVGFLVRRGLVFDFGDSREAPEGLRESAERKYESFLGIYDPESGNALYLFVLRRAPGI